MFIILLHLFLKLKTIKQPVPCEKQEKKSCGRDKRIGSVAEKLVPFMALLYILLSFGVVFFHLENVPGVFSSIIQGAFSPSAVTGGVVGSFFTSMKRGVSRGIFSIKSAKNIQKQSTSAPTVVFGLLGVIIE